MPFFNSNNIDNNFFSAYTTISSASTFVGTVSCFGNGKTRWEFPDGYTQTSATTHYNIPGSGSRLIKAVVNRNNNIFFYDMQGMGLTGSVHVFEHETPIVRQTVSSTVDLRSNAGLTNIIMPENSNRFIKFYSAANCSLSGRLDLSTFHFSGFPGDQLTLYVKENSNLSSIVLKDEDYNLPTTNIDIFGCSIGTPTSSALSGTIEFGTTVDLRNFKALGGSINLTGGGFPNGNSGITYAYFPESPSGNTISVLALNGLPNFTGDTYNLDLSWAHGKLGGSLIFNHLPQITGLTIFSSETNSIGGFDVSYCDLQGDLYLTACTHLSSILSFNNNTGLTAVYFSNTTGNSISQLNLSNTDIRNLDLSMFLNIGDYAFSVNNCSNLTGLTLPNDLINMTTGCYVPSLYACDFRDLDFSNTRLAHNYGTRLTVNDNPNLTGFTFPHEIVDTNTGNTYEFMYFQNCNIKRFILENLSGINHNILQVQLQNNAMTVDIVNEILVKFDNTNWTGNTMNISGTNAAPDSVSGGFDGIAAYMSLTGKSWTVIKN